MTTLRPARPEDAPGIRELFRVCHKRGFSAELWRWQYIQGAAISDVAVISDRIIGHLASLPVRLDRGTQTAAASVWIDLMVHPEHRNLELFLDLAEAHRAHCAQAGRDMLFAFPNDRSYPLLKRMLNWLPLAEIDALEGSLASLPPVPALPKDWKIEPCTSCSEEFDAFWEKVRPPQAWSVRRDSARITWRYLDKPSPDYKVWSARDGSGSLRGWLAAKIFPYPAGPIGDILDLWTEEPNGPAHAGLWNQALDWFRSRSVGTVSAWALPGSALAARFQGDGLGAAGPRTHFAGRWAAADAGKAFPGQGSDWQVAKGDSDVF